MYMIRRKPGLCRNWLRSGLGDEPPIWTLNPYRAKMFSLEDAIAVIAVLEELVALSHCRLILTNENGKPCTT
jgi:hypothetical protein